VGSKSLFNLPALLFSVKANLGILKVLRQRRGKFEGNQVAEKTTLPIWWVLFVMLIITKTGLSSQIYKTQETLNYIAKMLKDMNEQLKAHHV